jgi:hypothetical protein
MYLGFPLTRKKRPTIHEGVLAKQLQMFVRLCQHHSSSDILLGYYTHKTHGLKISCGLLPQDILF